MVWLLFALFFIFISPPVQAATPEGWVDTVEYLPSKQLRISGWARDPDHLDKTIDVHFYVDGPYGSGTMLGFTTANITRNDVGNHGFSVDINLPTQFQNGTHTLYTHGIDLDQESNSLIPPVNGKNFNNGQSDPVANNFPLDEIIQPFWLGHKVFNEAMLMLSTNNNPAEATFLFPPTKIISVKNSALTTTYQEGIDWIYESGKLKRTPQSSMPYFNYPELFPPSVSHLVYPHSRQISVTYEHNSQWLGPIPGANGNLPKTASKLSNRQPLKIIIYGDSISVGADSSSLHNLQPQLKNWGEIVKAGLEKKYHSPIELINNSKGGTASQWAKENVRNKVSSQSPDLVILGFGMNDGTGRIPASEFINNIISVINDVLTLNPHAEFILISPTLANPDSNFSGFQETYRSPLLNLVKPGIAVLDMTGIHQELLKHKKYVDMTGNNMNHPNDYLIRWHAQGILSLLDFPITPTPIPLTPGDVNGDKKIDLTDYSLWKEQFILGELGTKDLPSSPADFNQDNKVNILDYSIWKQAYINSFK